MSGGAGGSVRWKEVRNPVALSGPTYDDKATVYQTNVANVMLPSLCISHVLPCVKDCDEWIVKVMSDCIITNCVYVQTMYLINLRASSILHL